MRGNPAALAAWREFQRPYVSGHKFATAGYWAATKEASAAWKRRHESGERSNPSTTEVVTEVAASAGGTLLGIGIVAAIIAAVCSQIKRPPHAGYVPGNPYQNR